MVFFHFIGLVVAASILVTFNLRVVSSNCSARAVSASEKVMLLAYVMPSVIWAFVMPAGVALFVA